MVKAFFLGFCVLVLRIYPETQSLDLSFDDLIAEAREICVLLEGGWVVVMAYAFFSEGCQKETCEVYEEDLMKFAWVVSLGEVASLNARKRKTNCCPIKMLMNGVFF